MVVPLVLRPRLSGPVITSSPPDARNRQVAEVFLESIMLRPAGARRRTSGGGGQRVLEVLPLDVALQEVGPLGDLGLEPLEQGLQRVDVEP